MASPSFTCIQVGKGSGTIATRSRPSSGSTSRRVTVELVSNGGAFGGKEDLSNQAQTALAALLLDRPVKCTLTREQSLHLHAKRHPIRMEVWAGCDAEGKLTAFKARMIGDSGPYASVGMKVLERAAGHATGPYHVPAVDVESIAVRTNNSVGGAFRGFGANQAQFAMEGVIDRLAEMAGIDRLGDATAQRRRPRRDLGPGSDHGRRLLGSGLVSRRDQTALRPGAGRRQGSGPGSRSQELRAWQRFQGMGQGSGSFRS